MIFWNSNHKLQISQWFNFFLLHKLSSQPIPNNQTWSSDHKKNPRQIKTLPNWAWMSCITLDKSTHHKLHHFKKIFLLAFYKFTWSIQKKKNKKTTLYKFTNLDHRFLEFKSQELYFLRIQINSFHINPLVNQFQNQSNTKLWSPKKKTKQPYTIT